MSTEDPQFASDRPEHQDIVKLQALFTNRPYRQWAAYINTARRDGLEATRGALQVAHVTQDWAFGWSTWSARGEIPVRPFAGSVPVELSRIGVTRPVRPGVKGAVRRSRARIARERPGPPIDFGYMSTPLSLSGFKTLAGGAAGGIAALPLAPLIGASPLLMAGAGAATVVGGWQTWRWRGKNDKRVWTPRQEYASEQLAVLADIAQLNARAGQVPTLSGYMSVTGTLHDLAWQALEPDVDEHELTDLARQVRDMSQVVDELLAALAAAGIETSAAAPHDELPEWPTPSPEVLVDRVTARALALREVAELTERAGPESSR